MKTLSSYVLLDSDLLLDVDTKRQKEYVIKFRDLEPEEKPRKSFLRSVRELSR